MLLPGCETVQSLLCNAAAGTALHLSRSRRKKGLLSPSCSACLMPHTRTQGPPEWHPAPQQLKDAARAAADYCSSRVSTPLVMHTGFVGMQLKDAARTAADYCSSRVGPGLLSACTRPAGHAVHAVLLLLAPSQPSCPAALLCPRLLSH